MLKILNLLKVCSVRCTPSLQCFDTVGWQQKWHPTCKNPAAATPKGCYLEAFVEHGLSWSNLQKTGQLKPNISQSSQSIYGVKNRNLHFIFSAN